MKVADFYARFERLGFTRQETEQLRRIEMTLHRWAEAECNGEIQRDGDDCAGKPFREYGNYVAANDPRRRHFIPDRERGALRRLTDIMAAHPELVAHHQTDPRGCALYVVWRSDIPEGGDLAAYYTRGLAACY